MRHSLKRSALADARGAIIQKTTQSKPLSNWFEKVGERGASFGTKHNKFRLRRPHSGFLVNYRSEAPRRLHIGRRIRFSRQYTAGLARSRTSTAAPGRRTRWPRSNKQPALASSVMTRVRYNWRNHHHASRASIKRRVKAHWTPLLINSLGLQRACMRALTTTTKKNPRHTVPF